MGQVVHVGSKEAARLWSPEDVAGRSPRVGRGTVRNVWPKPSIAAVS